MKKALITGVTGQDGSYLVDILLDRGYEVHGLYRRVSGGNFHNIQHVLDKHPVEFHLHRGDIQDPGSVVNAVATVTPDEVYHMADQDNVGWSHDVPTLASDVTARGTAVVLEAVRVHSPRSRVFVPCSATVFGDAPAPQDERTPFNPQSPYAVGKAAAFYWARYYREVHGLHVVVGIMYNHDSPRRQGDYLLHKICRAAASGDPIELGDPRQRVDIGDAREFMKIVHKMMQLHVPDDFVVGTGESPTIGDVARYAGLTSVRWGHPDRPGRVPTLVAYPKKLNDTLGQQGVLTKNVFNVVVGLLEHYGELYDGRD